MSSFSDISIIYNPNSTGVGRELAQDFKKELAEHLPKSKIKLVRTRHAGHGETLAYRLALVGKSPLIISASGDGGYHEVVNGLIKAQAEGAKPVAGLLPAGNANDHYHNVHHDGVVELIARKRTQSIDLLELQATIKGKPFSRYAHSYIGLGLTPEIGAKFNQTSLNWWRETVITLKGLLTFKPVRILRGNQTVTYDSLIFTNVGKMSKYFTVAKNASPHDGKFELNTFRKRSKFWLLRDLVFASTIGMSNPKQLTHYDFKTLEALSVQLDGEIHAIDSNTKVTVKISKQKLRCII